VFPFVLKSYNSYFDEAKGFLFPYLNIISTAIAANNVPKTAKAKLVEIKAKFISDLLSYAF
jgi:hypothetical protein